MKYDPLKSFGYPVLRPIAHGEDPKQADYPKCSFQASFAFRINEKDPSKFLVSYDLAGISVTGLQALIKKKKAKYIVQFQCKSTFYSATKEVEADGEFEIDGDMLRDWVELSGYVVASGKCKVTSDQINDEFGYNSFDVDDGAVLAWAPPTAYTVEKDFYRNIRSIFEYRADETLKVGQFFVDLEEDYVFIHAHPKQVKYLRNAEVTRDSRYIVLNAVFFPVVYQMAVKYADNPELANKKRWGMVFASKCAARDIKTSGDPNLVAQSLLQLPLKGLSEKFFNE